MLKLRNRKHTHVGLFIEVRKHRCYIDNMLHIPIEWMPENLNNCTFFYEWIQFRRLVTTWVFAKYGERT